MKNNLLKDAINLAGGSARVADKCGKTRQAVEAWIKQGHLPMSEWKRRTNYAGTIARMQAKYRKADLLGQTPW